MPIQPDIFQEVAKKLNEHQLPTGEGKYRTVAGRAYYAAYLATRDAVKLLHTMGDDYSPSHEAFSQALAAYQSDPEVSKLGHMLNGLRLRRVRADYKLTLTLNEADAEAAIDETKDLLELLPKVATKLPRI